MQQAFKWKPVKINHVFNSDIHGNWLFRIDICSHVESTMKYHCRLITGGNGHKNCPPIS